MSTLSFSTPMNIGQDPAPVNVDQPDRTALRHLGFWSALATTLFGFGYGLAVVFIVISNLSSGEATAGWRGIEAYQAEFRPNLLLPIIPSLLLAPAFAALMVCVHYY